MRAVCCSLLQEEILCATYIGIAGYGTERAADRDALRFLFLVKGMQREYRIPGITGGRIQNRLEPGRLYRLTVAGSILWDVKKLERDRIQKKEGLPVTGVPGKRTLKNFLSLAMEPVGRTLYVFGGGWNWQDAGSGRLTRRIGMALQWQEFFLQQDEHYRYRADDDPKHSYYPAQGYNTYGYAGLDCSGYIGWAVYNLMETRNDRPGYVRRAVQMARDYAVEYGFGTWTGEIPDSSAFRPGDIFSLEGHVWICVGRCRDGSLVILHSTPSDSICGCPGGGVQLSGLGRTPDCEGWQLADYYMKKYFPEWSKRYRAVCKSYDKYVETEGEQTGKFSWQIGRNVLLDPERYREKTADEVLTGLFEHSNGCKGK